MLKILIDESIVSSKLYKTAFFVIFLVVLLGFSNVISGDFVADDMFYIVNNESIRSLFSYDLFFPKKNTFFTSFNTYRPIYNFVLAVEYALFGLNSIPYHIFNILLHTINTFFLYLLTLKYTDKKLLALLTAIIFAVHPIHTEAVSNITGLSEVLTSFFALFAIWLYSKSKKLDIYYISSLLCYLFAIFSKENGVVALGVIILLDVCSNWSNFSKLKPKLFYYGGYFFVLFSYLLLKINLRGSIINNKNLIFIDSFSSRIYTMSLVFIKYICLLIFPNKLIALYDTTIIKIVNQINFEVALALILIFALLITGVILLWYQRLIAFSILFFFGTMSVVSNVFFDIGVIMAERFLYFPSISVCLIFGAIFYWLINHSGKLKVIGVSLFTLVCLLATVRTYIRNLDWLTQDSVRTSFINNAPQSPRIALMLYDRALELFGEGKVNEAITVNKELTTKFPNYAQGHYQLGKILHSVNKYQEALPYLARAKQLTPQDKEISLAYALALLNNGIVEEAKTELESLIKENPNLVEAHNYLGIVYLNLQLYTQARKQFEITLKINPNYKPAEINLIKLQEIISNTN